MPMTVMRTRGAKGSELTHNELDANFDRDVKAKTTTYACLVSDNRSLIECNHATTPFTVTLGDAATMAAAETGDYEVTIANIGAAAVTVARAGTDTIDGAATSITLLQNDAVTLKVNSATNGYVSVTNRQHGGLRVKVIDIGDWNMDATAQVTVAHGLTLANIRRYEILIRNDTGTQSYPITYNFTNLAGSVYIGATNVIIDRFGAPAIFDSVNFDSTGYNRGWITIWYVA